MRKSIITWVASSVILIGGAILAALQRVHGNHRRINSTPRLRSTPAY